MLDLTIVIPTVNRAALLARCLTSIAGATTRPHEAIVVEGASTDATPAILAEASAAMGRRLRVIRESRRGGFVKAANLGLRAARGRYVTWLNDDATPLAGSLDRAVAQLEGSPPTVGMVALFHSAHATRNIAFETEHLGRTFHLLHVRGTLYANFGMARRSLFEQLGYFDERYFLNAADPDFSLKVWHAGLSVIPAPGALIAHEEHEDARREADRDRAAADNAKLFAKWDIPDRNPAGSVFDPARPCTLYGLRPPPRLAG